MADDNQEPEHAPDDEERAVRAAQEWDRRRAERSDAQWWEEDHLTGARADHLRRSLSRLCEACRIATGPLLSDLREIENLSGGYQFFRRRDLPQIIKQLRDLGQRLWAVE